MQQLRKSDSGPVVVAMEVGRHDPIIVGANAALPLAERCRFECDMGLLPDRQHCGLRMRRGCWERSPLHRLQRKTLVSDPGMHHGTCVTYVL